jgi:hypothetical protein
MLKWAFWGLLAFLLYRWVMRMPRYGRLFAPEHLVEISAGLGRSLPVAIEFMGKSAPADPFAAGNAFMTSADVAIFYTIAKNNEGVVEHHISMSHKGGRFASAAGGYLGAAMGRMLGIKAKDGVLALSNRGVFHYLVSFSAPEHARFVERGIQKLDDSAARQLVQQAMDDRADLLARLGRIDVGEGQR